MAIIEGIGQAAPNPVCVRLTISELLFLEQAAFLRDRHRQYRNSTSGWKRGSTPNPIMMGLVGEYAFQKFLGNRGITASVVDTSLNNGDDGKDAIIAGVSYQIKTSAKSFAICLVRRVGESKKIVPHSSDRFVFCRWNYGEMICDLRGWCDRRAIREHGHLRRGKTGNWFNNEIDSKHFVSMNNLVALIKQEARCEQ